MKKTVRVDANVWRSPPLAQALVAGLLQVFGERYGDNRIKAEGRFSDPKAEEHRIALDLFSSAAVYAKNNFPHKAS